MKYIITTLILLAFSTTLFAENHSLSTMTGERMNLHAYDHTFAGSFDEHIIWGEMDEATFSSRLIIRKYGKTTTAIFKKSPRNKLEGTVQSVSQKTGHSRSYHIEFVSIDHEKNQLIFKVNQRTVLAEIASEGFESNHFINPTYTVYFEGSPLEFSLKGKACYGLSIHYIMMIMGAALF